MDLSTLSCCPLYKKTTKKGKTILIFLFSCHGGPELCLKAVVNPFSQDHGGTEPASGEEDPSLEVVMKSLTDEESNKAVSDLRQYLMMIRA